MESGTTEIPSVQDESCCQTRACAPCDDGSCCCNTGRTPRSKTVIFTMVMLLAVGVAAFSMAKKNAGVASASAYSGDNQAVSMTEIRLGSVEEAEKLATGRDVTFLLLPGQDASSTNAAQERVADAFGKLLLQGQKAAAFTLPQNTGAYGSLMKRFGVDSSPCVIVLGSAGPSSAVFGDITETKLLRAAVMAGLPSGCCPGGSCSSATACGSGAGCCPVIPTLGKAPLW